MLEVDEQTLNSFAEGENQKTENNEINDIDRHGFYACPPIKELSYYVESVLHTVGTEKNPKETDQIERYKSG